MYSFWAQEVLFKINLNTNLTIRIHMNTVYTYSCTHTYTHTYIHTFHLWVRCVTIGDELLLSSKTLLEDAVKGRTPVVALIPPSERKLKVARGTPCMYVCMYVYMYVCMYNIIVFY